MDTGAVPAGTHLTCKFGRNVNSAAASRTRWSCVFWFLT